jgi:rubrerythrin
MPYINKKIIGGFTMQSKDLSAVLNMAIDKEIEAHAFYLDLHGRVTDPEAKQTLQFLANEEKKHRDFLTSYKQGGGGPQSLKTSHVIDYKIAEHLEKPDISGKMESKDAYLIAAHRELNSYNFYKELAEIHPKGETREMLLKMANEEMKHKEKVEYLYSNTAFTQTAGG